MCIRDSVEVEDEVNYIQEYAKIIQYRFMGKIRIIVNLEEAVRKKKVIKLILQPLVENAVFHGLERKIERGEVRVQISKGSEFPLLLVVEDNGCGIEEDMLADIRSGLEKEKSGNGIGIANIYQRLKLFYGNDMHFQIESEYGKGTRIEIGIPDEITWEV